MMNVLKAFGGLQAGHLMALGAGEHRRQKQAGGSIIRSLPGDIRIGRISSMISISSSFYFPRDHPAVPSTLETPSILHIY